MPWIPGEHRRGTCVVECVAAHLRGFDEDSRSKAVFCIDELPIKFGYHWLMLLIFVWVARTRTFLNTDQEMGEFMSQSPVRQSGLPRMRGQGVASVAIGA